MSSVGRPTGLVGPNAIIQVVAAVTAGLGGTTADDVLARADLLRYRDRMPDCPVAAGEVAAIQRSVRSLLRPPAADAVLLDAGRRTGDYILRRRIPAAARVILPWLPAPLAARALIGAMTRHAWTFAGSGTFRALPGRPLRLEIEGSPLCLGQHADRPLCSYFAATFQQLFVVLVDRRARVTETCCEAAGGPVCRFEVHLAGEEVSGLRPAGFRSRRADI